MKGVKLFYMFCLLGTTVLFSDLDSFLDPGYENSILSIIEINGINSSKVIISFENPDPICTYSPESFNESLDGTIYRAFIPRTVIAQDVVTSLDIQEFDEGVELILNGKSIKKIISGNNVLFIIEK